jgi:Mg-chelatase subunit ChlD/anti-sigma factor RsiW
VTVEKSDSRLTAYAFDELSTAEKAALEAELAADEDAAEEVAEIHAMLRQVRSELTRAPAPRLEPARRQQIEQAVGAPRRQGRRLWWGVASAGALVASAVLLLQSSSRKGEIELQDVPAELRGRTPRSYAPSPRTLYQSPPPTGLLPDLALLNPFRSGPVRAVPAPVATTPAPVFESAPALGLQAAPAPRFAPNRAVPDADVKAGEWDDNANYREFMRWLASRPAQSAHSIDIRDRRFIVVRDADGRGVPACRVVIEDDAQRQAELTTSAAGRAVLFPHAEGLVGGELVASTACGDAPRQRFSLSSHQSNVVELRLPTPRVIARRTIDVAFILDSTGSMNEEIDAVKVTVRRVAEALRGSNIEVRLGLVEYRDRRDAYVTRVFPFTRHLEGFSEQVAELDAGGGGDAPESVNEALHVGMNQLAWDGQSFAKLAFLIGDAPPHLDYDQDYDYVLEAREAAHRGIQLYTIAASGMDALGQVVWRQIAAYTGATNLFVLRGGAGPQSAGAGDPKSSCGGTQTAYTSGNLDALILAKINGAIKALDRDPLRIPGLNGDENAKPCAQRIFDQ